MLLTAFSAPCPPVAATYCWTMYLAVEASYVLLQCRFKKTKNTMEIWIDQGNWRRDRLLTMEPSLMGRVRARSDWAWNGMRGEPTSLSRATNSLLEPDER